MLCSPDTDKDALQQLAFLLIDKLRFEGKSSNFACHKEALHLQWSGEYALKGLATDDGALGAATVCAILANPIEHLLLDDVSKVAPWSETDVLLSLVAFSRHMPVGVRVQDGIAKTCFADSYNGVNAAWSFLTWAWASGRCTVSPLTPPAFRLAFAGQREHATSSLISLGIVDSDAFERKRRSLQACAKPLIPFESCPFHGKSLEDLPILPCLVFAHVCEFAQVLVDERIGQNGVNTILRCGFRRPAVVSKLQDLVREDACRSSCYMQQIVSAALDAKPRCRISFKRPASGEMATKVRRRRLLQRPVTAPRTSVVRRRGKRVKKAWEIKAEKYHIKDNVPCNVCGRYVRRDNISRHQSSKRCRPIKQRALN